MKFEGEQKKNQFIWSHGLRTRDSQSWVKFLFLNKKIKKTLRQRIRLRDREAYFPKYAIT